ncbi:MAG: hypothetical protein RI566_00375 [Sediminimonas sp.]|uniref:hypothetical protein n=1 Tax=Sediminimonas sp. TaxID=2823379 RepID=UPI00287080EE|nr:hypothetical protein [Sediminimonas sp.]MDR9483602.1 hypothetical protein [Sediminimonas sp.]
MSLRHDARARRPRTVLVLLGVWAGLAALWWALDATWWIVAALALFTLPALWEVITDRRASLHLQDGNLHWRDGARGDSVALDALDHVRFDTRLDMSVRVTLILSDGRRIRLPHASLPPHRAFETALKSAGVATRRHHFRAL